MKIYTYIFTLFIVVLVQHFSVAQDIIVLNNGDLIKSKVIEIGLAEIKYQRFDQKSGPVYELLKSKIFAIHYEDGTKDVFSTSDAAISNINKRYSDLLLDTMPKKDNEDTFIKKQLIVHCGLGIQKLYSPITELGVDNYKHTSINWHVDIGVGITTNTAFGFSYTTGSYLSNKIFEDNAQFTSTKFTIQQSIKSFSVWSRYYLKTNYNFFRPYGTIGLTLNRSDVSSLIEVDTEIDVIKFYRGGKIMDVIPLLKAGAEIDAFDFLIMYAEIGYDITLVKVGVGYVINK